MNDQVDNLEQIDEEILICDVSDEELEAAGGRNGGTAVVTDVVYATPCYPCTIGGCA